jgi:flagellin-specific chaperone FliS
MEQNQESLTKNYQANGAYRAIQERNLTPLQILLELYKGIIQNLDEAKNAYRQNNLGKMCLYNQKTFLILSALKDNMDRSIETDFSKNLDTFYTAVFFRLAKVLERDDPITEYEIIEKSVRDVYHFWASLEQNKNIIFPAPISEGLVSGTELA